MIRQQESIIQKTLMQLYDYCIISHVKKLTAEYHLMSDEQLIDLLIKTRDEIQSNRTNKLLRNINLFIICRSLFGYMGLYNVYNKIILSNSLKKPSYTKISRFHYLSNIEMLYIAAISLIIAFIFRTYRHPYYTCSSLLKLLDSTERLDQYHAHNNILYPVVIMRNILYSNKVCALFNDSRNLNAFQYIDSLLFKTRDSHAYSSYDVHHKLHKLIKSFSDVTTIKRHAITYTQFNTQKTNYSPIYDYVWHMSTIPYIKNSWKNNLEMDKAYLSDLGEIHELILNIKPVAYAKMRYSKQIINNRSMYLLHKKLPLNIIPDGLMSSVEYTRLYNLYKIYMSVLFKIVYTNNGATNDNEIEALEILTKTIIEEKKHKNSIPINDIVYNAFRTYNNTHQDTQRNVTTSNDIKVFDNRVYMPSSYENIHYIYYDKLYDKYMSILRKIRKNLHKEYICIAVESRETLVDICSLLYNNSIMYRLYDFKKTSISLNYVVILSTSDIHIYRLHVPNSCISVIEFTSDIYSIHSKINNVVYYLSKEDPLLANRPIINNDINQGYYCRPPLPQTETILDNIDKNKATMYNSSSIRRLKYMSVYRKYIIYTIHINNLLTDINHLKYKHYKHLIQHAITYAISMHITSNKASNNKNTLFSKLVMNYNINNKLDQHMISTNHIEQKNKLKRSQLYKQKMLVEHMRIHDSSNTQNDYVKISVSQDLNNMAYIIKKTIIRDIKDIYNKNTYNIFKQNKHNIQDYDNFLYKTLLVAVIRMLSDIYYNYNKP